MLGVSVQKDPINGTNCFLEDMSFESEVSQMMHVKNASCGKCNIASQKGNLWQAVKYAINYAIWKIKLHAFLCVFTVTIHGEPMRKKSSHDPDNPDHVCLNQVPET